MTYNLQSFATSVRDALAKYKVLTPEQREIARRYIRAKIRRAQL